MAVTADIDNNLGTQKPKATQDWEFFDWVAQLLKTLAASTVY